MFLFFLNKFVLLNGYSQEKHSCGIDDRNDSNLQKLLVCLGHFSKELPVEAVGGKADVTREQKYFSKKTCINTRHCNRNNPTEDDDEISLSSFFDDT